MKSIVLTIIFILNLNLIYSQIKVSNEKDYVFLDCQNIFNISYDNCEYLKIYSENVKISRDTSNCMFKLEFISRVLDDVLIYIYDGRDSLNTLIIKKYKVYLTPEPSLSYFAMKEFNVLLLTKFELIPNVINSFEYKINSFDIFLKDTIFSNIGDSISTECLAYLKTQNEKQLVLIDNIKYTITSGCNSSILYTLQPISFILLNPKRLIIVKMTNKRVLQLLKF